MHAGMRRKKVYMSSRNTHAGNCRMQSINSNKAVGKPNVKLNIKDQKREKTGEIQSTRRRYGLSHEGGGVGLTTPAVKRIRSAR